VKSDAIGETIEQTDVMNVAGAHDPQEDAPSHVMREAASDKSAIRMRQYAAGAGTRVDVVLLDRTVEQRAEPQRAVQPRREVTALPARHVDEDGKAVVVSDIIPWLIDTLVIKALIFELFQ
jgi:hypothetical protein